MKEIVFFGILMFITCFVYAQNNDLIVTAEGDSIACEILEVTDSEIIFKMKSNGYRNVQTKTNREDIVEFKYDVIQEGMYIFKPGTSYIVRKSYPISRNTYSLNYLQNASVEELKYYHYKALKLKKDGKTVTIVGGATIGAGILYGLVGPGHLGTVAIAGLVGIAGLGTMAVGIPMNVTGKKRVERINTIKNTAYDGIKIDLKPCAQYNLATQNYQLGVTLRISF